MDSRCVDEDGDPCEHHIRCDGRNYGHDGCTVSHKTAAGNLSNEAPGYTQQDCDQLIQLAKELFRFADRMSRAPHFIVQPIMGITKRNLDIIDKFNLL